MISEPAVKQVNTRLSLQDKVDFLKRPDTYPGMPPVEAMETHMSWLFFVDRLVYKLKKPVRYDYLDFTTPGARYRYCHEEVCLHKSLSGDTYIGVLPLTQDAGGAPVLGGRGEEAIDWLVCMKRLPHEHMLDTAIHSGRIDLELVQRAGVALADFYEDTARATVAPDVFRQRLIRDIETSSDVLLNARFGLPHTQVIAIATRLLYFVVKQADLFDRRVSVGRVVDAHGDLRPEHICLAPWPVVIDSLEFNPVLRELDVADELASLAMECEVLGAPAAGQLFLNIYEWKDKDRVPEALLNFYKARRAFVRARLAISHLLEDAYQPTWHKWKQRCEEYLAMAEKYTAQW